ncbi:hypothetical protein TorRG33x02_219390 [Trema orientale]|uniref:Uncharacterized protein n=1 Tax=Trema orientale TaxID=63057 RepID=A0A2P5E9K8_TREOI|nr:hypothetical protein TorRG33x02_219390 [Trema orientale]
MGPRGVCTPQYRVAIWASPTGSYAGSSRGRPDPKGLGILARPERTGPFRVRPSLGPPRSLAGQWTRAGLYFFCGLGWPINSFEPVMGGPGRVGPTCPFYHLYHSI